MKLDSMSARLKALHSSLGVRLLIPLLLTAALVLAAHALITFRSTRQQFIQFAMAEADRATGFIRRATHDGMLLNRLDDVQATIENLADEPEIAAIRIYDKDGTIVLSSERREIGRRITVTSAPCSDCHPRGSARGARPQVAAVTRTVTARFVRELSVLEKDAACTASGCHSARADQSVLGVLDVEVSMLPMQLALASARRQLVWTTLVLMLVIGAVATLIVRLLIHRPISRLKEATRRVAGGDLTTRIEVKGGHELAFLAHDFNRMAEDLSKTQREVTEWSQKLEEKVVQKTAELQSVQRQVLHMEKMSSLGKLSATVAHELNNPMSGMLTYARLIERELAEQPLQEDVRTEIGRYLHLVQSECTRCGDIVRNLITFARRTNTDLMPIDLNKVVERSLMLIRHQLEINRIRLEATYLNGNSEIVADAGQLEQALVALFINAAEAMSEGGVLTVVMRGNQAEVEIEIRDDGAGIPADILPLIFEPFFTTKTS